MTSRTAWIVLKLEEIVLKRRNPLMRYVEYRMKSRTVPVWKDIQVYNFLGPVVQKLVNSVNPRLGHTSKQSSFLSMEIFSQKSCLDQQKFYSPKF
jgi:hypothetical protein